MKYPKILYVKKQKPDTEDEYLECGEKVGDLAEIEDAVEAAKYQLIATVNIKNATTVESEKDCAI